MSDATQTTMPGDPPRLQIDSAETMTHVTFPRKRVDGVAVRELYEAAATLSHGKEPCLLVDLTGVSHATSGLMGILVTIQKLFRHVGGHLHVSTPDPLVLQQFEQMNLHLVLRLFDSVETASQFKE
mgnify:FL=1